ncbi:MAG: sigma-54-dependent Fis family transcriptional regulator [Verrucomicrobia bacterium]|nr:sigma-54-dependent Fis family transcriptional regulator [Verrucomicrobiota bacterium]NDD81274.1 sigma-54-dependent Fis family transcriptional regulator [Verrucomicrobiota bacterium]
MSPKFKTTGSGRQRVLVIDDDKDVAYSFQRVLSEEPVQVAGFTSGEEGLKQLRKQPADLVLLDVRIGEENGLEILRQIRQEHPRQLVIVMTAHGTAQTAIEAMKHGAFDYVLKPFDVPELLALLRRALQTAASMEELTAASAGKKAEGDAGPVPGLIGTSASMQKIYKLVGQVARSDASVLLVGESGTGKELIARAIYANSPRAARPYVAINCAAIPDTLLESELFGHERGAFTGALTQRIGKFERADGGTIFLDEIGDMPLALQAKLLRILQNGEFQRLGGDQTLRTRVRVIAATNKDLAAMVKEKTFREDLFYRLNVVMIQLPPLRERGEDILPLADYFLQREGKDRRLRFSASAKKVLQFNRWPGNVRELENAVQRAVVCATSDTIEPGDLSSDLPSSGGTSAEGGDWWSELKTKAHGQDLLGAAEKMLVEKALQESGGNVQKAADVLGVTRAALRTRVQRHGLLKKLNQP